MKTPFLCFPAFCALVFAGQLSALEAPAIIPEEDVGSPEIHEMPRAPEKNPPVVARTGSSGRSFERTSAPLSQSEWTLHKSADGSIPSGVEQQYVWLMNRARTAPETEGVWLSVFNTPDVRQAINLFGVDQELLRAEFSARDPAPPAAFDIRIHEAARAHSEFLIANDTQSHDGQFQRIDDAGFSYTSGRGSVFSFSRGGIHGHAAFNIDWGGNDDTGMQEGRGHRKGIMGYMSNVGVAALPEGDPDTSVGPQVTTINYLDANASRSEHFNRFIVGTVWEDKNGNRLYDPGEGIGGVSARPDSGAYFATTGDAGGYAIPVAPGEYEVTFSGGGLEETVVKTADVGGESVRIPWIEFPSKLDAAKVTLDFPQSSTRAEWDYFLGEATSVRASADLDDWSIVDEDLTRSGDQLRWSGSWAPGTERRFWKIRTWQYGR